MCGFSAFRLVFSTFKIFLQDFKKLMPSLKNAFDMNFCRKNELLNALYIENTSNKVYGGADDGLGGDSVAFI